MNSCIYEGERYERATSSDSLSTRLTLNEKYSSTNFTQWLMKRLNIQPGEAVLDVGCGTGAQSLPFLQLVGENGSVSALDISPESVKTLEETANSTNLQAAVADMADLEQVIANHFRVKQYDLAQSSYALYYSSKRLHVLNVMRASLKKSGRLAVFTPNTPHGMVEFARQFTSIPAPVDESLQFGQTVLEPYFRQHFWDVSIFLFHNVVTLPSVEDFLNFYRATTYYSVDMEGEIAKAVKARIDTDNRFEYEKNGYLIVGENPL